MRKADLPRWAVKYSRKPEAKKKTTLIFQALSLWIPKSHFGYLYGLPTTAPSDSTNMHQLKFKFKYLVKLAAKIKLLSFSQEIGTNCQTCLKKEKTFIKAFKKN